MPDVAAIEHATLAAVPPQDLQQWDGWLLPLDPGTVGRCHSAVPLRHVAPAPGAMAEIERRYAAAGLPAVFRLPQLPAFDALCEQLRQAGYRPGKPTLVLAGRSDHVAAMPARCEVALETAAGADWESVFLGEGFDPVDGASRLAILRRGRDSVFASVRRGGRTVAVGAACFSHGWCGIHGMRTLPAERRQGVASSILGALAGAARARGVAQVFLQVEQGNAPARALYERLGFGPCWGYAYWKK